MLSSSFADSNSFGAGGPKPNFALNFITETLDSRVTFSRTSHATRFNSSGVLVWAPNNTIRNNTMVGAVAGTPGTSPTNWSISPPVGLSYKIEAVGAENGISYIDLKISGTANAATTFGGIFFPDSLTLVPASSGQTWTTSCYFKLVAGNFNNVTTLYWNCVERNNAGSSNGLTSSSNLTSVTSAALDTQRYSVSRTFTNATTVYTMSSLTLGCSINAVIDFTIRVGMPQLELGSTATTVNATSGTAYYGPRFDYDPITLQPRGLLIELGRTNSIRNNTMQGAVAGTPGTMPTNWTISARAGITTQVVGVGTESGINYIDVKLSGTPDVGVTQHFLNYESSTQVTSAVGQTWNASAYYKLAGGSTAGFSAIYHVLSSRNASAGEISQTSVNFQSTISSASLVSQRIQCSLTTTSDLTAYVLPYLYFIYTGAPVDITIRIGMPQCENNNINTGVASATVSAGGSGYNVGDILEVVGGTGTKARLTVATLSGSAVATVTVSTVGSYSVFPTPQPVSVTAITGTGINATFNITPQTQTGISTSAIPTYSVGVQRNAENASITGTNFSSWYNSTAGTIYAEYSISTASQSGIVSLNDGTANNKMDIRPQTASSIGNTGGTLQWALVTANPSTTTTNKFALAYAQDDIGAVLNNGAVQTDTSATIPTVTNLQLGGLDGSTTNFKPNGYLRRIAYYPRRLTNSELKNITS